MNDQNEIYNVKVREEMEVLARNYWDSTKSASKLKFNELASHLQESEILMMDITARAMVARMAKEVRQALYSKGIPNRRQYLIQRGLIPNTKTDRK